MALEPEVPDGSEVLREALLAQASLTGTALATNIKLYRPGGTWPSVPLLVLTDVDAIESESVGNHCRVQGDLWAGSIDVAGTEEIKAIAKKLQAVSRACDGDWTKGKIRKCRAPNRLPSPEQSGRGRIIIDFELDVTA